MNIPLLTMNEFSSALRGLQSEGTLAPQLITVSMVNFVYLCSDLYELVKSAFYQVFEFMNTPRSNVLPLLHVFELLDLVCGTDDLASANKMECDACAGFASLDNAPVLEYLWRVGFYWDENTLLNAVKTNSFKCFQFALQQDCPLSSLTFREFSNLVASYGSTEMCSFFVKKQ